MIVEAAQGVSKQNLFPSAHGVKMLDRKRLFLAVKFATSVQRRSEITREFAG